MRSRIAAGVVLVFALLATALVGQAATTKHWAILNFADPVFVADTFVLGPVLIVHDDAKMARGEPCTTLYRFAPGKGPGEALASFHCRPVQREIAKETVVTVTSLTEGCRRLVEYQIAGDTEAHRVPDK